MAYENSHVLGVLPANLYPDDCKRIAHQGINLRGNMAEIEVIQAISSIASSISTVGVLIWWVVLERKRSDALLGLLSEDWKRQREEEIEKRAEERYQKKLTTSGSGL